MQEVPEEEQEIVEGYPRQLKLNKNFIGIDIGAFLYSEDEPRLMQGDDLKSITEKLKNDEHLLVMHTMPGNDRTCLASPLQQWRQKGGGLAKPYQEQQGDPGIYLPNFYVSPIPTTFKEPLNYTDMGQQRYLIEKYIAQLYYYAGLGFSIVVPVRDKTKDDGSDWPDCFGRIPNHFNHPVNDIIPNLLNNFSPSSPNYEYAFGAGIDAHFCKNHGAFLEKELNNLEAYINTESWTKKQIYHKYSTAFRQGQEKSPGFQQKMREYDECINQLNKDIGSTESYGKIIEKVEVLKYQLERWYFSYDSAIPSDALINDPQLRKKIEVAILRLKHEKENTLSKHVQDEKQQKIDFLIAILDERYGYGRYQSDNYDEYDDRANLIDKYLDLEQKEVIAPRFSRTRKLIDEIKNTYPINPYDDRYVPKLWGLFFMDWILTLVHQYLYKIYLAAKEKAINEKINLQALPVPPKVTFPEKAIYLVVNVDTKGSPGWFFSTPERCSDSEITDRCRLAPIRDFDKNHSFFTKSAALLYATKLNLSVGPERPKKEAFILKVFLNDDDGATLTKNDKGIISLSCYDLNGKCLSPNRLSDVFVRNDGPFLARVAAVLSDLKEKINLEGKDTLGSVEQQQLLKN